MLRLPRKIAKDSDELIIDEVETAIINAEKKCSKGKCTLPETQHLQIRVNIFLKIHFIKVSFYMITFCLFDLRFGPKGSSYIAINRFARKSSDYNIFFIF